jgi:protein required for attachment to host cells
MRQNLSKEAQKMVEEEIAKDISWFGSKDIEDYFKSYKH